MSFFQTAPITTLPPEILSVIFSLVIQQASPTTAHTEFVRLSYVCHLFYDVASNPLMWKLLFAVSFDLRGYETSNTNRVVQTDWKAACQSRIRLLKKIETTLVPAQMDDRTSARYYMWMKNLGRWTIENDGHIALQFARYNVKRIVAEILQSLVIKLRDFLNPLSTSIDQNLKCFHQGVKVLSMAMSWSTTNADILDKFLAASPLFDQFRPFVYANALPSRLSPTVAHGIHAYAVMCFIRLGHERDYELPLPIRGGSEMFLKKSQAAEKTGENQHNLRLETERDEENEEEGGEERDEEIDEESSIESGSDDNDSDDSSSSSSTSTIILPDYIVSPYRTYTGKWAGYYLYQAFHFDPDEPDPLDKFDSIMHMDLVFRPAEGVREESSDRPPMRFHGSGTDGIDSYLIRDGYWDAEGSVTFEKHYGAQLRWDYRGTMIQAGVAGRWGRHDMAGGGFWMWKVDEGTEP